MREHPIPQDITGYRFHIIGNMTLKQFGELALGVILAVVVYASNLPLVIKWPIIIIFVVLGVVAAFVPIAERPLDHWLLTFFRVLYRPTLYYWKKTAHIPEAFSYTSNVQNQNSEPELDLNPVRRQRIKEYISSVSYTVNSTSDFDQGEITRMQTILNTFDTMTVQTNNQAKQQNEKPQLDVRVRAMRPLNTSVDFLPTTETTNALSTVQATMYVENTPELLTSDTQKHILETNQVAQQIQIPETQNMQLDNTIQTEENELVMQQSQNAGDRSYVPYQAATTAADTQDLQTTQFNTNLPFPKMPDEINKPVGMVLSSDNELIMGAIVEIKTQEGLIERAVKTNALGQFFINTPISPGSYILETTKPGFIFQPQTLVIQNEVVPPIEVIAQAQTVA